MVAGCTNPASLSGGAGELDAYHGRSIVGFPSNTQWTDPANPIETEFVKTPGLVRGECVQRDGYSYLEVTVQGDPNDPRTDDIPGDLIFGGTPGGLWGLHAGLRAPYLLGMVVLAVFIIAQCAMVRVIARQSRRVCPA